MQLIRASRRITSIGSKQIKPASYSNARYSRLSRPQASQTQNSNQHAFLRHSSASAAVAVAEDVYAPPVSYPPSVRRPLPGGEDVVQPLEAFRDTQPMSHSWVGLTGGQIFCDMMRTHKVKHIFGYPGGAILPVFDAIFESKDIDFVLPKHEQGAGHMAEGYARANGKPGVVLVTSGPGGTNLITPLQDALMDGTPLVAFTGQVPTPDLGTNAFQEANIVGIAKACTKWCVQVKSIEELPRIINEAFHVATSGRPGPVLVDLPKDTTAGILQRPIPMSDVEVKAHIPDAWTRRNITKELESSLDRVTNLLSIAKKPIIYAGQGVLSHPDGPVLLRELSRKACIPVTTTLLGLGAFDEEDSKALHMLGMHGSCYANMAMQHADLVIALGARFDDRITRKLSGFVPEARLADKEGRGGIVHFEILPENVDKVLKATTTVRGDLVENLASLLPRVKPVSDSQRYEWLGQINEWKEKFPWTYEKESSDGLIKPQTVIRTLDKVTAHMKDATIIATGVGSHQMFAAQHYRWRHPRSLITSGGLGTMGYGLPAAIGAKLARPGALVIDVDGDSSFGMTLTELVTCAEYKLGVKTLVLNNEEQGMVTHSQQMFFNDRYSHTHGKNADFVKLGDAMGVKADRVKQLDELEKKMKWLLFETGDEPALLEVVVDQKVPVLPIVMPGTALHEFVNFDEEREKLRRALTKARSGR